MIRKTQVILFPTKPHAYETAYWTINLCLAGPLAGAGAIITIHNTRHQGSWPPPPEIGSVGGLGALRGSVTLTALPSTEPAGTALLYRA